VEFVVYVKIVALVSVLFTESIKGLKVVFLLVVVQLVPILA
jgi:hypothetical protein